ncbi:hypothetical protein P691DRAFT_716412 [Macrolepiota fuliginosa MF-IS2]|uniref:F-box domain-containing protein n=1 Tax=Macrolepiota fuliginosa MF-IS2 TaxID=1400762 RepID=A0A9P5XRZ2_9AGAR|nr:hypothetical protein P691DRAFT_716412 [Macrolepiota fuliginosa MF-IS2]
MQKILTQLPHDILILVLELLASVDLAALGQTCRALYLFINEHGWTTYLRTHPRPSCSLVHARAHWSARRRAKYDALTDVAWQTCSFVARPLANRWISKHSPLLAISKNRLVVVAGNELYSYSFGASTNENSTPSVSFEASFSLLEGHARFGDITAISLAFSDERNDVFFIAFQDGLVERITITTLTPTEPPTITRHFASTLPNSDFSESLSSSSQILLSLSSNGSVSLADYRDVLSTTSHPLTWYSTIDLKTRSWASHLSLSSSTPYAAFGTSNSPTPLQIYSLPDAQFTSETPSVLLSTGSNSTTVSSSSAVYGLSQAPPSSPWGSSPQIIVAGWYDSKVRCYDLRTPSSSAYSPTSDSGLAGIAIPTLCPVLSLHNPWSYEPIYSVSCGGGSGSHIAAGSARHSVLSFWDIRSPQAGWSVHAPGNDPSPVYSVVLESSRCFGATESRPFVYDFGPGVIIDTYPPITRTRGDKLKPYKTSGRKGIDYYVTKYHHSRGITANDH